MLWILISHPSIAPLPPAVTYTSELIPWSVNNTLHPDFTSYSSEILPTTYPLPSLPPTIKTHLPHHTLITYTYPTTQKTPDPCPPLTLRTNPAAARDPQAPTARIWTGVGWVLGSFTQTAVNNFQEKNRDRKESISHLGVW